MLHIFTSTTQGLKPIFFLFTLFGIVTAISSPHWFNIWIGLEINLYSFLPFILGTRSIPITTLRQEAAAKYFFSQAIGSIILLTAAISYYNNYLNITLSLFLRAILLKAGAAPFHFWYPRVIATLPWSTCWFLSTIQKFVPLFLLIRFFPLNPQILLSLGVIIVIVGGIGGLNQSQLRAIIAYSTIGQIGWIIATAQCCSDINTIIFFNYLTTISAIITIFIVIEIKTGSEPSLYLNKYPVIIFIIIILLISLAGIPVLIGFFPKAFLIKTLIFSGAIKTTILLILGALLNLYFYIKIILTIIFSSRRKITPEEFLTNTSSFYMVWFFSIIGSIVIIFILAPWILP